MAFANYEGAIGVYPPGRMSCDGWTQGPCAGVPGIGRPGTSGFVMLLPYLELDDIYAQFGGFEKGALFPAAPGDSPTGDTDGWKTPQIAEALKMRPAVFVCPSDIAEPLYGAYATGSYALCQGSRGASYGIPQKEVKHYNNGVFMYKTLYKVRDITDGLSHTFFVGEGSRGDQKETVNRWTNASRHLDSLRTTDAPMNSLPKQDGMFRYDYWCNGAFRGEHPGGCMFLFGDGHAEFIAEEVDQKVYEEYSTRGQDL